MPGDREAWIQPNQARFLPCSGMLGPSYSGNRRPGSADVEPEASGGLGKSLLKASCPDHFRVGSRRSVVSNQVGALHTRHTHMATSPPWHERTLVSAHPTGSTHPRIAALLTLFLLSPKSAPPRLRPPPPPPAVADTAQLLSPSLAVAGLSQPPQPAASQACPSEPAGCGERGWSPGARLRTQEGRRQTPPARFQAGWVQ